MVEPKNVYNKIALHLGSPGGKDYYQAYAFYDQGMINVFFDNIIGQVYTQLLPFYFIIPLSILIGFVTAAIYLYKEIKGVRNEIQKVLKDYFNIFMGMDPKDAASKVITLYNLNDLKSQIKKSKLSFLYKDLLREVDRYFEIVLFYDVKRTDGTIINSLMDSVKTEISSLATTSTSEKKVTLYEIESVAWKLIKETK
jgi:hypothetical protein